MRPLVQPSVWPQSDYKTKNHFLFFFEWIDLTMAITISQVLIFFFYLIKKIKNLIWTVIAIHGFQT